MASRHSKRLRAKTVPAQSEPESDGRTDKTVKRRASVYDAVAGRVTSHQILPISPRPSVPGSPSRPPPRDPARYPPLAPEEVLFRRKNAPPRYAERDVYFAGTDSLAPSQRLPDSDLLKAIHGYAAGFYEALTVEQERKGKKNTRIGGRAVDERSMDETALLAFGVLLEEAARETLGKNGDLVFTEGFEDEGGSLDMVGGQQKGGRGGTSSAEDVERRDERPVKKRRLSRDSTAG